MGISLAGAASGAQEGLDQYLARKLAAQLQAQQLAAQQAAQQRAAEEMAMRREDLTMRQQAAADLHARQMVPTPPKRTVVTTLGPRGEPIQKALTDDELAVGVPSYEKPPATPAAPRPRVITTIGPRGQPIQRTATDEELAAGMPVYLEPKGQTAEKAKIWVTRSGQPQFIDPSQVQPGDAPFAQRGAKTATGADRQAFAFYNRAKNALDTIEGGEPGKDMETQIAHQGVVGQAGTLLLPNAMQSQLGQSYRQAQRAFTEARLRKESGAAINDAEYAKDARTYFAQPGDSPQTIAQKRASRKQVLEGLAYASGPAYEEYYGEAFKPMSATVDTKNPGNVPQTANAGADAVARAKALMDKYAR